MLNKDIRINFVEILKNLSKVSRYILPLFTVSGNINNFVKNCFSAVTHMKCLQFAVQII